MFETLELQNLKKLSESEVRDFAFPEAFHTAKVQRLGRDNVKPLAQVGCQLPMPISALVGDMSVESRQLIDRTPPVTRTFDFSTQGLIEFSELSQGLFQELWRLYFLSVAQCQKCVFHAEVCAYTFTRSRQDFFGSIIGYNIKPIRTNIVAKDLKILDIPFPFTVFMESEPTFVELQTVRGHIPGPQRQSETSFFKFIARLELRRTVAAFAFVFRFTCARYLEKAFPRKMQADNHSVKGVTRYPCPMFLVSLQQLRQVWLQAIATGIFTIAAVIPIFQLQEVVMDIAKVIEHVAQTLVLRMFAYLIFIGATRPFLFVLSFFYNAYQLPVFNPCLVGGTDNLPRSKPKHVCQLVRLLYHFLTLSVKKKIEEWAFLPSINTWVSCPKIR